MKQGLKKVTKGSIRTRSARILKAYRLTACATTGVSLLELLLGHRPKSRLDLLKPMTADRVEAKQFKQKQQLLLTVVLRKGIECLLKTSSLGTNGYLGL